MADTKSKGLFGLPHYRNSRASMELYEPVYLNIFTVQLAMPASLGLTDEDTNLFLEGVKNVSGLQSHSFPEGVVDQKYKYATRSFAKAKPNQTTMDITMNLQINLRHAGSDEPDLYTLKMLRAWCDLVYDPLTGMTGLKKDYVAPHMMVTMQDRAGNPFWGWILYNVFPTKAIKAPDLAYESETLFETEIGLRCDYWNEMML